MVKLLVLDLIIYKGGVCLVKCGGGYQINFLWLEGVDGWQYVLCFIDKDVFCILGYFFNEFFVMVVLEDNFSFVYFFVFIVIVDLVKVVGIYYMQFKMFYLFWQLVLGIYNEDYVGVLYIVEECLDDEVWNDYE